MADFDARVTIEIAPRNRHLRLWVATWRAGGMSGTTDPLPRELLAERLRTLVAERLEIQDQAQNQAEVEKAAASGAGAPEGQDERHGWQRRRFEIDAPEGGT